MTGLAKGCDELAQAPPPDLLRHIVHGGPRLRRTPLQTGISAICAGGKTLGQLSQRHGTGVIKVLAGRERKPSPQPGSRRLVHAGLE